MAKNNESRPGRVRLKASTERQQTRQALAGMMSDPDAWDEYSPTEFKSLAGNRQQLEGGHRG